MKITPLVLYSTFFFWAIIWSSNLQMNNMSPLLISSLQEFSNHIKKAWFGQGFPFALSSWKIETIWNFNSRNESQLSNSSCNYLFCTHIIITKLKKEVWHLLKNVLHNSIHKSFYQICKNELFPMFTMIVLCNSIL